ncbi:PREDICTED: up-regulator of cell proliferation-like [Nanorana parkeri]|uniref:up-regulator of cell proliferation-like n=1 Tax=Nanorana parkeri TaxID=125878 RepID=UPI000854CA85|nr:PREDICTED: up-regulator of cell proliferation-like [Nanorana parkeri]
MAYCEEASRAIDRLKEILCQFPEDDLSRLSNELKSLNVIRPPDLPLGSAVWSTRDKLNEVLNTIVRQGESACQRFLFHLEKLILRFPALSDLSNAKRKAFCEITSLLGMKDYGSRAITLREVLTIGQEDLKPMTFQTVKDNPWFFLRMLMSLNINARNAELMQSNSSGNCDQEISDVDHVGNVHPLDVLCAILHCSDGFLQQEIVSKMSMCQFAVPLLLPACDSPGYTFMLWAMRDIVKKWRPHSLVDNRGFKEGNIVNISMPIFSFVRLGDCSLSKSDILNHVLSSSQRLLPFFIHRNMEGGNIPRKISDGLVETSWYFPAGQGSVFPEPIMVTNLRGDVSSNWTQFTFLTEVSTAIFIFVDSISEDDYQLLSRLGDAHTQYYFVISNASESLRVTQNYLKKLSPSLKIDESRVLLKRRNVSHATVVKKLQFIMADLIKAFPKVPNLEDLADKACKFRICVDENSKECLTAKRHALEITEKIEDVETYKQNTMILQGVLWKKLADTDKELHRRKKQGDECLQKYSLQLRKEKYDLLVQKSKHSLPPDIAKFIKTLTQLSHLERCYFLKWMKILLDSISAAHPTELQDPKSNKSTDKSPCLDTKGLEGQKKSAASLGLEHFIRELAQFYEAESFMVQENKLKISERKFRHLPGVAADLLLDGFPLEMIDGDASNVPLQWITDVLTELDEKTAGQCRMRVVTVLGVQSTGKSTLLNTMFGLHFPVASGRCTRGAFMTLIKVKENFQEELGCHFILVIDTEGLKAPENMSLQGSYDHDNELATLVVGLSDITLINLSMENVVEMSDILQIVVHAFLRMSPFGRKPNCRFVHQNVCDIAAHWNNLRGRAQFKQQLDEMTKFAAKMEKRIDVKEFADVLDHDLENHSVYIPGLWCGDPPMASVGCGYSENVNGLKRNLLTFLKHLPKNSRTIYNFLQWVRHLWDNVRRETFIFSFRNSVVASAYDQLTVKFSELQWKFRKATYHWLAETENEIRNQTGTLQMDQFEKFNAALWDLLQKEESSTKESLEKYFEDASNNGGLIERYKEEFFRSLKLLRSQYESQLRSRLEDAIKIQKNKNELQAKQDQCHQIIEDKVSALMDHYRERNIIPNSQMIDFEFTKMWEEAFSGFNLVSLKKLNIKEEIFRHLQRDLRNKSGLVTAKLFTLQNLEEYEHIDFRVDPDYTVGLWGQEDDYMNLHLKLTSFVNWLLDKCIDYVTGKAILGEDYQEIHCQDLLDTINKELNQENLQELHTTDLFEADVKLLILGRAAPMFQMMHDYYVQENDPKLCLGRLKPQYFSKFQNIFQMKDLCQTMARNICDTCLKPAITEYIYKNLGKEMVDDILVSEDSQKYSSRTFFQFDLLKTLLLDNNFNQYADYTLDYKRFVDRWISKYIHKKYKKGEALKELHAKVLSFITRKVVNTLNDPKVLDSSDISKFMEKLSSLLARELVIPRRVVKAILYQSQTSVEQFSSNIQDFLPKTEVEIGQEFSSLSFKKVLSKLTVKPEDELFKRVFGCGKQCPFCRVPCEAGGLDHQEHFASIHRPQALGGCKDHQTRKLDNVVCTTDVLGNREFRTGKTENRFVPYSQYRWAYPNWSIQPDRSLNASDYWKYVLKEFNKQFAEFYSSQPADIPEDWQNITQEQAMKSLQETFNIT